MYTKDSGSYYSIPNDCEHFDHDITEDHSFD